MKSFAFFFAIITAQLLSAQIPYIEWQKTIGGERSDRLVKSIQTNDGGYLLAGYSDSDSSSQKTEDAIGIGFNVFDEYDWVTYHYEYVDIWLVKLDAEGNIEWENTIGGDRDDFLSAMIQTADGGYLLAANSESDISGDKTEDCWAPYLNSTDYWIIKLDAEGTIVWQNTIGGEYKDWITSINQTADGGYILGGLSRSPITGDKTEAAFCGGEDLWIIKITSIGTIQWQNTIGGCSTDNVSYIEQTSDGGYIVGATSYSGIYGDKTEICYGNSDYWILKLSPIGTIVWQNTIGGNHYDNLHVIHQLTDGSFIVGGNSGSDLSFDKTEANIGSNDFWILKLTSTGSIIWQNTIGGISYENLSNIQPAPDGGYFVIGSSSSGISGDKTISNFDVYATADYWVLKLDALGNIEWQSAYGGNEDDYPADIQLTDDGGFILSGFSYSPLSGNKTEASLGEEDYWFIKLSPECYASPEICNVIDDNCNGLIDDDIIETITIIATGPAEFCQGGSVLLNATYSGTTLQWQKNGINIPGATTASYTATTKGNYSCTTTSDCGMDTSDIIFVNVFKNPKAIIEAGGPTTFCMGGSVTLNVSPVAGSTYQWYKNAIVIPGATTTSYLATTAGIYKCRVTKIASGCFKNSAGITVSIPCKEGDESPYNNTLNILPNPNNGTFNISINDNVLLDEEQIIQLEIYTVTGQLTLTKELDPNQNVFEINLPDISAGIYIAKVIAGTRIYEEKLIIE
ncbi:MAG: T9SS type A sorting domain-containing protein [Chitinophagales bacterium]